MSILIKGSTLLLKVIKPLTSKLGKKIDTNYFAYRHVHKLLSTSNSFDRIYSETIKRLEDLPVIEEVVWLFSSSSVRETFKNCYGKKEIGKILDAANAEIAVNEKLNILKGNAQPEIERFIELFTKQAMIRRTPSEVINQERNEEYFKGFSNQLLETFHGSRDYLDLTYQIKNFSQLRSSGQHKAALKLLEDYKQQNWQLLKPEEQRKLQINLGVTHFEMEQYEKASEYLIDTVNYGEANADNYAYAALGYAIAGDTINAKYYGRKAIQLDPNNVNACSAFLAAHEGTMSLEEIENLIPEKIRQLPVFALSLGARLGQTQQFDEAVNIYKNALQSYNKKDKIYYDTLYHLAIAQYRCLLLKDQFLFEQLSDEIIEKCQEILALYDECWNYFKDTDLRNSKWYILSNKATVLRLLKDFPCAEQVLRASIELKPTFFSYKSLYILLLDQNKEEDSILDKMLELASNETEYGETLIFKAETLLNKGGVQESIDLLLTNFDKCSKSNVREGYYAVLINALIANNEISEAEKMAVKFLDAEPDNFYARFFEIQIAEAKNIEVSLSDIHELKQLITPDSPIAYTYKLTDLYLNREKYEEAASVLEPVIQNDDYSPLAQRLLHCYYQSGNHEKGIPFAEKLLVKNALNPYVADYLSVVYETIGDYTNALRIIDVFLQNVPNDIHFKVKKVIILCKDNRIEEGLFLLNDMSKDIQTLPIDVQFFIAQAYLKVGQFEDGMEIAYNARMLNYAEPLAHENYLKLLIATGDKGEDFYFPKTIQENCHVTLTDDSGKQIEYIIVKEPKFLHEIGLQEGISQKLIGMGLSETVEINNAQYRINTITLKYTYAHHDSMNQVHMRFADQVHSMKIMTLSPNVSSPQEALRPFLETIDSSKKFEEELAQLYPRVQATIGSNAQLMRESPIDYWGRIVSNWEMGCYSIGSPDEYRKAVELLEGETPVVVDLIGLLTLFHIDGFDLFSLLKQPVYVTSSTIKVIEEKIEMHEQTKDSMSFSIGKQGSEYVKYEISPEEKERQSERLKSLLEKVKAYCTIGETILSSSFDSKKKLDSAIGESFHDSALLASRKKRILYSDDRNLRIVSFNQMQLPGMSTFIFLHFLLNKGLLTIDQYNLYMLSLVKHNYRVLPINETILFEALKLSNYKVQQPFINATDFFTHLDDAKAVIFAGNFLYRVYIDSLPIIREPIARFIIDRLFEKRNTFYMRMLFITYLNKKFQLLPIQGAEILKLL